MTDLIPKYFATTPDELAQDVRRAFEEAHPYLVTVKEERRFTHWGEIIKVYYMEVEKYE